MNSDEVGVADSLGSTVTDIEGLGDSLGYTIIEVDALTLMDADVEGIGDCEATGAEGLGVALSTAAPPLYCAM